MKKRICFFLLFLICVMVCFGKDIDLGVKVEATPYSPYTKPIEDVLKKISSTHRSSLKEVCEYTKQGRRIPYFHMYGYTPQSPEVFEKSGKGDCKDKALWLLWKLNDSNARVVYGKKTKDIWVNHAWLYWNDGKDWWILDCTDYDIPTKQSDCKDGYYIPLYSYGVAGCYRHKGAPKPLFADFLGK
jgi:hypothetical protein